MTEGLQEFARVAEAFCAWAEAAGPGNELEEAVTARRVLAQLIARAVDLELPDAPSTAPEVPEEQRRRIFKRFGSLPFNYYSEVFDPFTVPQEETVTADLADDLADIWADLKGGLTLFHEGDRMGATWQWAFTFSAHWGHHATAALYALQSWFSQVGDDRMWDPDVPTAT